MIRPVSSLRVANQAQELLSSALVQVRATTAMLPEMQTRTELDDTIGPNTFAEVDATIAASVSPEWAT